MTSSQSKVQCIVTTDCFGFRSALNDVVDRLVGGIGRAVNLASLPESDAGIAVTW